MWSKNWGPVVEEPVTLGVRGVVGVCGVRGVAAACGGHGAQQGRVDGQEGGRGRRSSKAGRSELDWQLASARAPCRHRLAPAEQHAQRAARPPPTLTPYFMPRMSGEPRRQATSSPG